MSHEILMKRLRLLLSALSFVRTDHGRAVIQAEIDRIQAQLSNAPDLP